MPELSILIPSRSEMFLARTIQDIIDQSEADTEVIATLDGQWADPPIPISEKVSLIYVPESIGQRAATNIACKLAKGKYVMKVDAHCSFDKGFDRKMLEAFKKTGDNVTLAPTMRNLWAFDWKCAKCGKKWYQGPTPTVCQETNYKGTGKPCDGTKFVKKMMWVGKNRPQSNSFCFDSEPHFQYFNEYCKRPEYKEMLEKTGMTESMSLQGSCWMSTKEKYWELDLSGETLGSWGNQGVQLACATWLSGGRVLINHNTWYAHLFRTQGGDFGFPYEQSGRQVQKTKNNVKELFWTKGHHKQIYPVSWLVEKFAPVPGWSDEAIAEQKENEATIKV
ncbi:MAG: glycosyltransferase [Candidatus Izemoplasmatales bacterium]